MKPDKVKLNLTTNGKKIFNPLTNRLLVYLFCGIFVVGYIFDIAFIKLPFLIDVIDIINIIVISLTLILFYFEILPIKEAIRLQILGLMANMILSHFINPIDEPNFSETLLRNAMILGMLLPVYGLYCGKRNIIQIALVYVFLYTSSLIRTHNQFLIDNTPMLTLAALVYYLGIYYIFDSFEKMNKKQLELHDNLQQQKETLIAKNESLEKQKEQISKQAGELKQLVDTRDKFFSIISHDLKNPFNIVLGYSELFALEINNFSKDDVQKFAKMINDSSQQIYSLLENLLEWSLIQTGKIAPKIENIDPVKYINEIIDICKPQAASKQIEIVLQLRNYETILADEEMLKTVLRNLVTNAIKYSNRQGTITIDVSLSDNELIFSVIDTGIGISEENLSHLFKPESKFSKHGTANEHGTGLGLALCREFIELNGGKIWAESELGKGSAFSFTLPVAVEEK